MDFFRRHILGMAIFAIVTGAAATFLYDYFEMKPKRTFFAQEESPSAKSDSPVNPRNATSAANSSSSNAAPSPGSGSNAAQRTAPPAFASTSRPLKEWEACVSRAEMSVDQRQVGVLGVEGAIFKRCGQRPVIEPDSILGAIPYDLVRSKTWAPRFRSVLGSSYDDFVSRIVVSSETELEGDWVVASGLMPHNGGDEEAAFAINKRTGDVFAAMMQEGKHLSGFGFGASWNDAPPYLRRWVANHKR